MKAVFAEQYGAPSDFRLADIPAPVCTDGQVRVRVEAAGVSFVDIVAAAGNYQLKPPLPFVPGSEFAGVVIEAAPGVTAWKAGDRVSGATLYGAFAEEICIDASRLVLLPAAMDMATGAVFRVSFATAYYALVTRGRLAPGETVLVLGAGGAVGHAAVQLARALGATVIAMASNEEKRAAALAAGADHVIGTDEDLRDALRRCAPDGVDVVVDPVGGALTEAAFRRLRWGGRHLVIGFAGGTIASLPVNLPLLKGADLVGVDVGQFGRREPEVARRNLDAILALHGEGKIAPLIRDIVPIADFAPAMDAVAKGLCGRIVLSIG